MTDQRELFERSEPIRGTGASWIVPLGFPVFIPWPGTWKVERTESGGHLVTLVPEPDGGEKAEPGY